jgi:hypothetical protein
MAGAVPVLGAAVAGAGAYNKYQNQKDAQAQDFASREASRMLLGDMMRTPTPAALPRFSIGADGGVTQSPSAAPQPRPIGGGGLLGTGRKLGLLSTAIGGPQNMMAMLAPQMLSQIFPAQLTPDQRYKGFDGIGVVDIGAPGGPKTIIQKPAAPNLPEGMGADGKPIPGYLDFAKARAEATRDPNANRPPATWRPATAEEIAERGLPEGTAGQISSDGKFEPTFEPRKQNQQLSATETKELFEADDAIKAGEQALASVERALNLNDKAASGTLAWGEQQFNKIFDKQAAADTTAFKTEGLDQALSSLRTIFGGNPTEGERGILIEMQAAPSMTRTERKALLDRTKEKVASRLENAKQRKASIEGGEFGRAVGGKPPRNAYVWSPDGGLKPK